MELTSIYNSEMAQKFATLAFRKANLSHLLYRDLPDLIKKYFILITIQMPDFSELF